MGEFIIGPSQFGEFAPEQEPIEGAIDLKPEKNKKMEAFVRRTAMEQAKGDARLEAALAKVLDSVPEDEANHFGNLAATALANEGYGRTVLEKLTAAALVKDDLDELETIISRLVENVKRNLTN